LPGPYPAGAARRHPDGNGLRGTGPPHHPKRAVPGEQESQSHVRQARLCSAHRAAEPAFPDFDESALPDVTWNRQVWVVILHWFFRTLGTAAPGLAAFPAFLAFLPAVLP
jgi:hypothetical protein